MVIVIFAIHLLLLLFNTIKKNNFLFASLQSDVAKEILLQFDLKKLNFDSIVLVEKENIYDKSAAVLRIAKQLSGSIQLLYAFIVVPHIIRDWVYDYIAKNRYKWFGKIENCMAPSEEIKSRFLDLL